MDPRPTLPAGWYLDRSQPGLTRWYDGGQFTPATHVVDDGFVDPGGWKLDGKRIIPATRADLEALVVAQRELDGREDEPPTREEVDADGPNTRTLVMGAVVVITIILALIIV